MRVSGLKVVRSAVRTLARNVARNARPTAALEYTFITTLISLNVARNVPSVVSTFSAFFSLRWPHSVSCSVTYLETSYFRREINVVFTMYCRTAVGRSKLLAASAADSTHARRLCRRLDACSPPLPPTRRMLAASAADSGAAM